MITVVAAKRPVFPFQPVKSLGKDVKPRIKLRLIAVNLLQGADCEPSHTTDDNAENKLQKVDMFRKRLQIPARPS